MDLRNQSKPGSTIMFQNYRNYIELFHRFPQMFQKLWTSETIAAASSHQKVSRFTTTRFIHLFIFWSVKVNRSVCYHFYYTLKIISLDVNVFSQTTFVCCCWMHTIIYLANFFWSLLIYNCVQNRPWSYYNIILSNPELLDAINRIQYALAEYHIRHQTVKPFHL